MSATQNQYKVKAQQKSVLPGHFSICQESKNLMLLLLNATLKKSVMAIAEIVCGIICLKFVFSSPKKFIASNIGINKKYCKIRMPEVSVPKFVFISLFFSRYSRMMAELLRLIIKKVQFLSNWNIDKGPTLKQIKNSEIIAQLHQTLPFYIFS